MFRLQVSVRNKGGGCARLLFVQKNSGSESALFAKYVSTYKEADSSSYLNKSYKRDIHLDNNNKKAEQ